MNGTRLEQTGHLSVMELSRRGFVNRFEDPAHREMAGKLFDANVEAYGGFTPEDSDRLTKLILSDAPLDLPAPAASAEPLTVENTEDLRESASRMVDKVMSGFPTGLSSAGGEGRNAFGAGRSLLPEAPDDGLQPYEDQHIVSDAPKFPPPPATAEGSGWLDEDCNYFNW